MVERSAAPATRHNTSAARCGRLLFSHPYTFSPLSFSPASFRRSFSRQPAAFSTHPSASALRPLLPPPTNRTCPTNAPPIPCSGRPAAPRKTHAPLQNRLAIKQGRCTLHPVSTARAHSRPRQAGTVHEACIKCLPLRCPLLPAAAAAAAARRRTCLLLPLLRRAALQPPVVAAPAAPEWE